MQPQKPPAFPPCQSDGPNVEAWYALHIDAALAQIKAIADRNWENKRYNAAKDIALREAANALFVSRAKAFRKARDVGQLLFCFHGTHALLNAKGGAA